MYGDARVTNHSWQIQICGCGGAADSTGNKYYKYTLLYVNDALCCSESPKEALLEIVKYFSMKQCSIGLPSIYLRGKINRVQLPNGVDAHIWSMSQYVQNTVESLEKYLHERDMGLNNRVRIPLFNNYQPELDRSKELNDEDASQYQLLM